MSDILDDVIIQVECSQCDASYNISATAVAESQQLLEGGCPGTDFECPASLFANLADRDALRRLAQAWRDLLESAGEGSFGEVTLRAEPALKAVISAAQQVKRETQKDPTPH